ncbi:hypothetical protein NQ317_006745 [Molorchus minor]|uniref:Integrase catalytic domain-containing protein n=1 Tax=Molorchus minor TaxID=1323400 RepID=A0ABQ9ITZ4_9CUCU|nr:hypothetical protein NQ317_006745 [Molorchus minor]
MNLKDYEKKSEDEIGPIQGKMILVISDTFSKWPEEFIMRTTDSKATVEKFRECFARFKLPRVVVTDNGPKFVSDEFSKLPANNGIQHQTSPPYHPATNEVAENSVKSLKQAITKALGDETNSNISFKTLMNRYLWFREAAGQQSRMLIAPTSRWLSAIQVTRQFQFQLVPAVSTAATEPEQSEIRVPVPVCVRVNAVPTDQCKCRPI